LITVLDGSPAALVELNCSNNLITSLPVLPNSLDRLNASNNQIRVLNGVAFRLFEFPFLMHLFLRLKP
jgi:Leucine-rich repeat (LRR) protein